MAQSKSFHKIFVGQDTSDARICITRGPNTFVLVFTKALTGRIQLDRELKARYVENLTHILVREYPRLTSGG